MNLNFFKFSKKFYFSYPCPRKLREIVKITLFEREQPQKIKEIWQTYYSEKPHAVGMDLSGDELSLIVRKYNKLNKKI
jgi:ATP synthase F1 complex assembly factor 1